MLVRDRFRVPFLGLFPSVFGTVPFLGRFRFFHQNGIDLHLFGRANPLAAVGYQSVGLKPIQRGDHGFPVEAAELAKPSYGGICEAGFIVVAISQGEQNQLVAGPLDPKLRGPCKSNPTHSRVSSQSHLSKSQSMYSISVLSRFMELH